MTEMQQMIIAELGVKPAIDPEEEINNRVNFLETYLERSGLNGYVLGISGGQDSLLAGMLAARAVRNLRERSDKDVSFHAVTLPYGVQRDKDDAELACLTLGDDVVRHDLNILAATDAFASSFSEQEGQDLKDYHKGNVKARMRMIAQYALAGEINLLVIGTDHAAEAVVGFYTKYGDGGADVLPLAGLSKRQGRQLLKCMGVPEVFTTKPPTADLLDDRPGQADETELGLSYEKIDDYLEGVEVSKTVSADIERRYTSTQHKRDLPVAFGGMIASPVN